MRDQGRSCELARCCHACGMITTCQDDGRRPCRPMSGEAAVGTGPSRYGEVPHACLLPGQSHYPADKRAGLGVLGCLYAAASRKGRGGGGGNDNASPFLHFLPPPPSSPPVLSRHRPLAVVYLLISALEEGGPEF